jgi:hypothetical protein
VAADRFVPDLIRNFENRVIGESRSCDDVSRHSPDTSINPTADEGGGETTLDILGVGFDVGDLSIQIPPKAARSSVTAL